MIDKPWVKHFDTEVPACLEYPAFCIQDFLIEQAKKTPNRIALYCDNRKITYLDLLTDSRHFAENLLEMGLRPNDRLAIALPNTIEFVIAFYGSLLAGGIVAAMNPAYPLAEWEYQAGIVKPVVLIGEAKRMNDLLSLQRSSQILNLVVVRSGKNDPGSRSEERCVFFDSMIHGSGKKSPLPDLKPDDAALLQFSGGTTGQPKAALALHRNVAANIIQFSRWLTTMTSEDEVFLTMIPLYHVYGMVIGLNVGIAMGASIVLVPDGRDLEKVLQLVPKYKVTFFPGVPSIYQAINHNQKVMASKINLRSIKACISGSAPLAAETRIQFESVSGAKLVEGYGLSEAPTATHCNPIKGENRLGSIGLPLPDVECRIVDLKDNKTDLAAGEIGELLIRSPQIMQEYFENRKETNITLKNGWLHTGDIARMDVDGYFYIVGRRKELIKVNGLQVWPVEVEKVIRQFHGIHDVVVAGIPDKNTGEAVKAWLVLEDPGDFYENDLFDFCRRFLAGYKVPIEVEIVAEFPRSAVGKVLRRKLVDADRKKISGA